VCRILNLPPHLLAELSHATYSNIEEQNTQFVQLSLRPSVKRVEVEADTKLFIGDDSGKYAIKFSLDGLMRGNTQARSAYYHNAILDGYMTPNEVRALEGMERADGLDNFLRPLNSAVVGEEENKQNEE
jgi:HK97 family phage portal protein